MADDLKWIGAFTIRELLERCTDSRFPWAPETESVYVITRKSWSSAPSPISEPLYVGGNVGKGGRFRTRLGDLIADAFGFYGSQTGHHSGGITIHKWCLREQISPLDLYAGRATQCICHRCLESHMVDILSPIHNRKRPARCGTHSENFYAAT